MMGQTCYRGSIKLYPHIPSILLIISIVIINATVIIKIPLNFEQWLQMFNMWKQHTFPCHRTSCLFGCGLLKKNFNIFFIVFHFHLLTAIWHSLIFFQLSCIDAMFCLNHKTQTLLFVLFCRALESFRLYYSFTRSSQRHLFNLHCITPSFICRPCFFIFFREHLVAFNYRLF